MILATILLATPMAQTSALPISRERRVSDLQRKMKTWRGGLQELGSTEVGCNTSRSTGDPDLDAIACSTLITCAAPLNNISARLPSGEAEQQQFLAAIRLDIQQCADRARRDQIATLVDERAASITE